MRDPKAIRKAIMTAKSIASLVDPKFARVPLPDLGVPAPEEYVPEHSPAMHEAFGVPMPKGYAAGGDVEPYQDPETSHISEWNWRPLEDVRSDLGYMREIPSHVLKFGDFMDEIARKASEQGLTPRDLIKAYTITRSSIQRRAAKTDKVRQAGLPLPDFHDEMIRPEGAFGEWLHTPAGQAYLDAAERGQVHHGAIQDAVRVMAPFGKHEKDIPDALAWAAAHLPGNESRVSELIHAGRLKASHPAEWREFTSGIRGIGPSKSGFYASLLGRGDQPTLDARQIILHTGRPTKEATRFLSRKGGAGGVEAVNRLTARQEAMGLELPEHLSPYYQHLAHHAVWDQAGGDETTHEDVMRSMRHAASGGAIMPHEHWIGEIFHRLDGSDAEHYAAGGDVDDQHPYAQPDNLGLYSHAAVTAAGLPQERGTPEQFRGMLLNKGVKPDEIKWSEYDNAFADKPQVTRDEVARHFWRNMTPIEELVFQGNDTKAKREEMNARHSGERWRHEQKYKGSPEGKEELLAMRRRHAEERKSLPAGDAQHEGYTLPGGENYREVLLQHSDDDLFGGVPQHFAGTPSILASLRMKDRQDAEGDKVLHLDELQSDWGQEAKKAGTYSPKEHEQYLRDLEQRAAPLVAEEFGIPESTARAKMPEWTRTGYLRHHHLADMLGESDEFDDRSMDDISRSVSSVRDAPYISKTEGWLNLGLKRALLEAAKHGHDKLAWTTGDMQADRYPGGTEEQEAKRRAGMIQFYDKMLPKALLKLAQMHDPEARFTQSVVPVRKGDEFGENIREEGHSLPALEITPKMRESILKNGFVAYAQGGEVEGHEVANPMSIFPKPQRMWDEDMPGGAYLSMPDKQDVTGHRASSASIGIGEGGKPYFNASRDPAEVTGSPGRGSATVKTNLFKQKAGWKWLDTPEGHDNTNTLVSVEHRGKHHYVLHAHFPKGVDLARYPDAPSEPRLRPTTKGNVELGPQVGSISVRGKEHPVHAHAIVKAYGGEVEGYADGGEIDPERFKQYMKRIHSPLSEDPESVKKALSIAGALKHHLGFEKGTGSFHQIVPSMATRDVRPTITDIPGIKPKKPIKGSWEDFYNRGKGGVFINMGGDLSNLGRLTHINGKELAWPVDLHAGTKFMLEPNPGYVWGNAAGHSAAFDNKIKEIEDQGKEAFGIFTPMGPRAVDSAHHMFDALMAQIPSSGADKDVLREFDQSLKEGKHLPNDIRSKPKQFQAHLDALENWPGLENAKEASEFARNLSGKHRGMIVQHMEKAAWRKKGLPEVGVTRAAITDPELLGVGGNKIGHRIVKLSSSPGKGSVRKFEHNTYPTYTGGEYVMDVPTVQRHYATPDVVDRIISNPDYLSKGFVVHPYSEDKAGRDTSRQLYEMQKQMQPVNQRMLDSVMMGLENQEKYGFKKGGTVRKAMMIAKGSKKK